MDDLAMTCSDFVNALKMLICSEKHPVSRANYGYTKKVVIDRYYSLTEMFIFNILEYYCYHYLLFVASMKC